jgi:pimeloyl-ACP methyl ester carboxylesterase
MTESIASNIADTAYEIVGSGPPMVLIHGVGLDRKMWTPMVTRLARRHTIVRYDLAGHGESGAGALGINLAGFADQLERLLDHLNLQQVTLVGFSLGALIARRFASACPDKLTHLILISSVFQRRAEQVAAVQSRLEQATEDGTDSIINAAIARWFTPAFIARNSGTIGEVRARLLSNNRENFLAAYKIFAEPERPRNADLRRIGCPALVTTGALDSGSTPDMARTLAAALGKGRAVILPDLAHMAPVEGADAMAQLLLDFLNEHASDLHLLPEEE